MDLLLLVLLILLNGLLAMAEIAVVASREARLQKMVNERKRGARSALVLKKHPASFLSTVQVGITMAGILSGAIGEQAMIDPFARWLANFSLLQPYAQPTALTLVVVGLTYFSVVIGELVPKHLGLLNPEKTAALIAPPMKILARIAAPLVYFFERSSGVVLQIVGAKQRNTSAVTNEEIKILMEQGAEAGIFHESEQMLVSNVLRLDEQPVVAIMTHRQDIHVLDLTQPETEIRHFLATCPFSRIVVCHGGLENVLGLLRTADLLKAALVCEPLEIERHLRAPLYVPEYVTTTQVLESFRKAQLQCALVVDEYGDIQGLVTLTDVLTAIVGAVPSARRIEDQECILRDDGSWLIGGGVAIEQVKSVLMIHEELSGEKNQNYHSLAGFVLYALGRVPKETDHFDELGFRFEVIDMDHNRIDKVLVSRLSTP